MNNESTINPTTKATRMQTIRAMETISASLGGKEAYIGFLEAMPDSITLTGSGLSNASVIDVAEDDAAYTKAVKAFASHMGPVMTALVASEG